MRNVIIYLTENYKKPCGSDYTIITELKTLSGIKKRYNEHNRRMIQKGLKYYIIIPYYRWRSTSLDDLEKDINKEMLYIL